MEQEPLSRTLVAIAVKLPASRPATLNDIIAQTGARGPYVLLIVLALPFVTPISLPGISNVIGVVMLVILWRLVRGKPAHIPKFAGDRPLQAARMQKILRASSRVLAFIEKLAKPRRTQWLNWRLAQIANASEVALMALMLALPIPPTIPLSNTLPGYAIILLSMSLMEEDGWLIWAAYVVTAGTFAYLVTMTVLQAGAIVALWTRYFDRIAGWFQ
jgi:hypothetical protein